MSMEISAIINFPADRIGSKTHPNCFGRNLALLRRLHVGHSVKFAEALKDPEHLLSQFLTKIDLRKDLKNDPSDAPAIWLTELSYRFDAFYREEKAADPALRIIAENLHARVRGRRFVLDLR